MRGCLYSCNECWSLFSAVQKGFRQETRGREREQLKWIQLQLFKVLTGAVEENPVDGCGGINPSLELILLKGPEMVYMQETLINYYLDIEIIILKLCYNCPVFVYVINIIQVCSHLDCSSEKTEYQMLVLLRALLNSGCKEVKRTVSQNLFHHPKLLTMMQLPVLRKAPKR